MSHPDDDTDVPSGLNDDAKMERTSPPSSSHTVVEQGRHGRQGEADTTEAEASAGVRKGNYGLAAATEGADR